MDFFVRLSLCYFILIVGYQSSDPTSMLASVGDSVSLPCGSTSTKSCSSVNWAMQEGRAGKSYPLVKSGIVIMQERASRLKVGKNCSLQIHHLDLKDGVVYICEDGKTKSNVSLELLSITLVQDPTTEIGLECYFNNFQGRPYCNNSISREIKWLNEDGTEIKGDRFNKVPVDVCFSRLIITSSRPTDHHRKWTCQVTENSGVKTSYSYTTSLPDGIEEVFSVVGDSVSLSCDNTSFPRNDGIPLWDMASSLVGLSESGTITRVQSGDISGAHINPDSSLVINKVSRLHSGYYKCALNNASLNNIKLYTIEVTAGYASPGSKNLTLTCLLTCVDECGKELNLTWAHSNQDVKQSYRKANKTLISDIFLPDHNSSGTAFCSIYREGVRMATKRWSFQDKMTVPVASWLVPLLIILGFVGGGGVYWRRARQKTEAEEAHDHFGMNHVYEVVLDGSHDGVPLQTGPIRRGAANPNDTVYDLVQHVN